MRIRYKKWARPELEASPFYIDNPEEMKGKWRSYFENDNPIARLWKGAIYIRVSIRKLGY